MVNIDLLTQGPTFITIIGRAGAGVPVERIESILEFNKKDEVCNLIFDNALKEGKLIKTLLDKDKIKSLVFLDSGEVHPSTFHYVTLRERASKYIPIVTYIGCDKGGINGNKVHLMIDYKYENANKIVNELLNTQQIQMCYKEADRTKCLLCMDSGKIYTSTFNYKTIKKRLNNINNND